MSIKNAAILLFVGSNLDRVVLLKHRYTNEWMLPGGQIDKSDKCPFAAMKREFKEETGVTLPVLNQPINFYIYNGHTKIYIGCTHAKIDPFIPNNEASEMKFVKIDDIFRYKLRNSVKKSLEKIKELGFLKNKKNILFSYNIIYL